MKELYWLTVACLFFSTIYYQYKVISAMPHRFTHAKAYYHYLINQAISFFFSLVYFLAMINLVEITTV